ncbi:hypothetical protein FOZ62_026787, partial [Perkinsus olseni]
MTRILNARYRANKLSSSYKPKDTLLLPTSDDIFMANNDDKKRGAWVSQDLLTQYAETAYHMYQPHEDNGEAGDQSVKEDDSRKRKQATIPHNWDSIVADRGREALMKERERIRCEEAQRDMELRHFMERKANADKVAARIPTVGKVGKGNKKGGHKQEATTTAAAAAGVAVRTSEEDAIISPQPEDRASTEQEGQAGNEDKGYAMLGTKGDVQEVGRRVSQEAGGGSEDLDQPEGSNALEENGQGPQLQEEKGSQLQEEKGQGPQLQEEKGPQLQEEKGPQLQEERSSLEAREGREMNRADQQGRAEQLIDPLAPDGGIKRAAGKLDAAGVEGNAADHRTPPVDLEYGSEDVTNIPEQSAYSESIGHESLHREPIHAQGPDVQQDITVNKSPMVRRQPTNSSSSSSSEKPRDVPSSATGAGALSLSLLSYPSEDTTDSIEQLLRHYEIPAMVEEESCVVVGDEEIVEDDWKVQLDNLKKELDQIYASCTAVSRSSTSKVADSQDASRRNEDISDTTLMLSEEESASFTSTELVAAIAEVTAGISGPYLGQASDYDEEDRCLGATIVARGNIREPDGPSVTLFHFDSAPPDVLANNTSSSIPFMVHASVLSVSEGPYWSPALLPQGLTCLSHNKSITESIFPFKDTLSSLPNIFTLSNSNLSAIVLHSADVASATGMPLSRLISELAARDDVTDVRQKYGCQRLLSYTHTEKGVT